MQLLTSVKFCHCVNLNGTVDQIWCTSVSLDEEGSEADGNNMGFGEYCLALCACACHIYVDPFLSMAQVFLYSSFFGRKL